MPTRRHLVLLVPIIVMLGLFGQPPVAAAQTAQQASAFVDQAGKELSAIINGPGDEASKKAQLFSVVERNVDVDGIARFCLGRFWNSATPAQQHEYMELFHRQLAKSVTGHLGEYHGVTMTVGRAAAREGGQVVASTITRPGQAPANVSWLVGTVGGQTKVVDLIAEGTSLRLTQRTDYASFLSQNGNKVQALVDALRRQTTS